MALGVMNAPSAHAVINGPQSIPFNDRLFDSCANNGQGEFVDFRGNILIFTDVTFNKAGGELATLHANYQGVSGVGETTGNKYQLIEIAIAPFTLNPVGGQIGIILLSHIITSGGDAILHINTHFTFNADGTTVAAVDNAFITCRL